MVPSAAPAVAIPLRLSRLEEPVGRNAAEGKPNNSRAAAVGAVVVPLVIVAVRGMHLIVRLGVV
jgi:hypothetical protein